MTPKLAFEPTWIIARVYKRQTQFYALDSGSGPMSTGYPYWSDYQGSAYEWKKLPDVDHVMESMNDTGAELFLIKIERNVSWESIDTRDYEEKEKKKAELKAKIAELEKELGKIG